MPVFMWEALLKRTLLEWLIVDYLDLLIVGSEKLGFTLPFLLLIDKKSRFNLTSEPGKSGHKK